MGRRKLLYIMDKWGNLQKQPRYHRHLDGGEMIFNNTIGGNNINRKKYYKRELPNGDKITAGAKPQ